MPLEAFRAPLRKLYEIAYGLEEKGEHAAALSAYQEMMAQTTEYKEILDLIAMRLKKHTNVASTSEDDQERDLYTDLLFKALMLKYETLTFPAEKAYLARY